jgi:hypothetical protein
MATTYDGQERRNVDYIEALINSVKELVNVRFEILEKRLDQIEKDISDRVAQTESRVTCIEEAPMKKAAELQKGFLKSGQEIATKVIWGAGFAFVGFLIVQYVGALK